MEGEVEIEVGKEEMDEMKLEEAIGKIEGIHLEGSREVEAVEGDNNDDVEDSSAREWARLVAAARRPGTGFPARAHRDGLLRTRPDSFTGAEAVEWLVKNWPASSDRSEALQLAGRLLEEAVIVPAKESTEAKPAFEESALYHFAERRKVVVVGGGFSGRKVAMKLQSSFDVTLVDNKDHFMCIISLPACLCDTDHLEKVTAPHTKYLWDCTIVVDEVVGLDREGNTLLLKSHGPLPYDYLVIGTGSRYRVPVQGNDQVLVIDPLQPSSLLEHKAALAKATYVTVVGAGPVGIEIAGEIIHHCADKQLTVIYSGKKMLERYCRGAHKNIKRYLNGTANARILKDQKVVSAEGDSLLTTKGERIRTDVAYFCVGFVPNTDFLQAECGDLLSERGHIKVNEYLQVKGHPNIFAVGDVADIDEEKLAQNAEKHGGVVAKNIMAMESGKSMRSYKPGTRILIISLGPKRAMVVRGDRVVVENGLAARIKSVVEYKSMKGF